MHPEGWTPPGTEVCSAAIVHVNPVHAIGQRSNAARLLAAQSELLSSVVSRRIAIDGDWVASRTVRHAILFPFGIASHRTGCRNGKTGMADTILHRCEALGLRLTDQRRVVAAVLEEANDHPDVEKLYARACAVDPGISLATVYRTVKLFEEAGILEKHEFRDGRARYEDAERDHHDHLIDLNSGEVFEFVDAEIEALQERIAARMGYQLKGHRLELYGVRRKDG